MSDSAPSPTRSERFDLRALYETSQLLSKSLDLEFVLNSLLLTVMSKLLTTRGVVLMYDPLEGGYRVSAAKGLKHLENGQVVKLADVPQDTILLEEHVPDPLAGRGIKLALPIFFGRREIGMLAVGGKATGEAFTAFEIEFVRSLVNMSSTAVHNSLMVEELQLANRDLDARVQELNTLFDLSQEFNATIDRNRLVKLLSFALMGQLLVSRHLFVLRRDRGAADVPDVFVASSKGISSRLKPELIQQLCGLDELVLLEDAPVSAGAIGAVAADGGEMTAAVGDAKHAGKAWRLLRDRGLVLALPLKHQGETCGALCLGPKRTGQPYLPGDVEFLSALGNLALVSIQNSFLVEEQIEKERLEEEMRLARRIQERLFPQRIPMFEGYDVAAFAEPSRFVGGDYYDVVRLEGDRLLVAVADVTGKGVPASLLMANLQASLHVMLPMDLTIEEAVGHINRVVCENTDFDKFITFFVAILHRETGEMHYVNAGHNPPMLVRANGTIELLETGGLLLGVMSGVRYERGTATLEPGDVLALYTDGVTEAMNAEGEEYQETRLMVALRSTHDGSAEAVLQSVRNDVGSFTGSVRDLSDDLTMVVVKRATA